MSLTDDGIEFIAAHKYKPGHYTFLDNLLNPFWTRLTEFLPMSLAPNAVTLLGALHCGLAYSILWYYSPHYDAPLPNWVVFLAGYCTIAYYTFDCMDGKQARRTGQSSPLGQLFDHGFDCICNLSHISTNSGYLMIGGTPWFIMVQGSLFFAFFMAQWEEYYTGELPHAMGNFGVTEVNYGLGLLAILNGFIDREAFWCSLMKDWIPSKLHLLVTVPEYLMNMQLRHFALSGWFFVEIILILGSLQRVFKHDRVVQHKVHLTAISKLVTPALIAIAPFWLPKNIRENETRYISICTGLLFSFLTKKMICFSMAKMTFATIQIEALPFWMIFLWIRYDSNITEEGATVLLGGLCFWYAYRLINWSRIAIGQICKRLDIHCFTIKKKDVQDKNAWKK
eukprot:CAMPEP_0176504278 /NCGR_PEP_ID=MMETSP0200_2-20121128/15843_1 /TAXON_ID=947934 /ORGANISM="Chaetoceros sp., Strain GSL56" /LENGTH=394 /DNA_ID=CAMNT_0017903689 /DNA_START=1118 /DNA_END=2299 /DNA_ORIENTATION=+